MVILGPNTDADFSAHTGTATLVASGLFVTQGPSTLYVMVPVVALTGITVVWLNHHNVMPMIAGGMLGILSVAFGIGYVV